MNPKKSVVIEILENVGEMKRLKLSCGHTVLYQTLGRSMHLPFRVRCHQCPNRIVFSNYPNPNSYSV